MNQDELTDLKQEIRSLTRQVNKLTTQVGQMSQILVALISNLAEDDEGFEEEGASLIQNSQLLSRMYESTEDRDQPSEDRTVLRSFDRCS